MHDVELDYQHRHEVPQALCQNHSVGALGRTEVRRPALEIGADGLDLVGAAEDPERILRPLKRVGGVQRVVKIFEYIDS